MGKRAIEWDIFIGGSCLSRPALSIPHSQRTTVASFCLRLSNLLIIFTLKIEAMRFSETSALTIATPRQISGNDILRSHRRENLKAYIALTGWAL
jgi:hypothetical protein